MNELTDVSQSQLTHTELAETTNNYLTIIEQHLAGNIFLMALVGLIRPALAGLRSALAAIRTNELVRQAFDLDQVRDRAFIVLRDMVAAYEKSDVPEEAKAYNRLWRVFEKVGIQLYNDGYLEQSARLEVLFQEMDKPQNQAALEVLGLMDRYTRLKDSEAGFKSVYNDRLEEDTKKKYPTIKESRKALAPLVADLLPTLRNVARTAEEGADLSWTALINEQTSRVMTQVAARRTRSSQPDDDNLTE